MAREKGGQKVSTYIRLFRRHDAAVRRKAADKFFADAKVAPDYKYEVITFLAGWQTEQKRQRGERRRRERGEVTVLCIVVVVILPILELVY